MLLQKFRQAKVVLHVPMAEAFCTWTVSGFTSGPASSYNTHTHIHAHMHNMCDILLKLSFRRCSEAGVIGAMLLLLLLLLLLRTARLRR